MCTERDIEEKKIRMNEYMPGRITLYQEKKKKLISG